MSVVSVSLKPITGKKDVDYFWKQVKKSGKPSPKALEKLEQRRIKEQSLASK